MIWLWLLLPKARRLGAVSFQSIEGVGWMCSIRPPHTGDVSRRGLNGWTGEGKTLGTALRQAMRSQADHGMVMRDGSLYAPKLGGREFDPD